MGDMRLSQEPVTVTLSLSVPKFSTVNLRPIHTLICCVAANGRRWAADVGRGGVVPVCVGVSDLSNLFSWITRHDEPELARC